MRRRVRAVSSLFFVLVAQARKLSLTGSLGWAEEALKCDPLNSDGGAAIEVLSVSSVFWVYTGTSVLVLLGRSTWLKIGLATAMMFLRRHRRGMLCYGL